MKALLATLLLLATPAAAGTLIDESGPGRPTIRVVLSDAADPGLAVFLREEAEANVAQFREMAAEAASQLQAQGGTVPPQFLTILDEDRFASTEWLSIRREFRSFIGGETEIVDVEALTVDRRSGTFLRLDAFLGMEGGSAALRAISADLRRQLAAIPSPGGGTDAAMRAAILSATVPDVTVLQNFTLVPATEAGRVAALAFHFAPADLSPYLTEPVEIRIPAGVFADGLKPAIRPLFGGTPAR